jgi:hypothetical protein
MKPHPTPCVDLPAREAAQRAAAAVGALKAATPPDPVAIAAAERAAADALTHLRVSEALLYLRGRPKHAARLREIASVYPIKVHPIDRHIWSETEGVLIYTYREGLDGRRPAHVIPGPYLSRALEALGAEQAAEVAP